MAKPNYNYLSISGLSLEIESAKTTNLLKSRNHFLLQSTHLTHCKLSTDISLHIWQQYSATWTLRR